MWSAPVQDWDGKHILLVFFILEKLYAFLILCVHTNKNRPFTVPIKIDHLQFQTMYYSYRYEQHILSI